MIRQCAVCLGETSRPQITMESPNKAKNIKVFDLKISMGKRHEERPVFQSIELGRLTIHMEKKVKLDPFLIPY